MLQCMMSTIYKFEPHFQDLNIYSKKKKSLDVEKLFSSAKYIMPKFVLKLFV